MRTVLVTGGCGYIGSHVVYHLAQQGYRVVVIDRVATIRLVHDHIHYVIGNLAHVDMLHTVCKSYQVEMVVHTAASIEVGASVSDPYGYYDNNVAATLGLLKVMRSLGIRYLINSSSAAVYGALGGDRSLRETDCGEPLNPYGWSKYIVEQMIRDAQEPYGLTALNLRYFNAAGATPYLGLGEHHTPETHLIPRVIRAALEGTPIFIYGTRYPTPDGTCVRDYVHVRDIARAHSAGLDYLVRGGSTASLNIASGEGSSVRQVIDTVEKMVGLPLIVKAAPERAGDPAILCADISRARQLIGWVPQESLLQLMVREAYEAHMHLDMNRVSIVKPSPYP